MKVSGWRAWYDDGASFNSETCSWESLPDDGVLVVMLYFDDGTKRIMSGTDYYWRADGHAGPIFAHDNNRPDEKRYKNLSVKLGRWGDDVTMQWALREANE